MSKTKLSPKEIIIPTVVLFIICAVSAALLGFTNLLTEEKIAEINALAKQEAMAAVMPDAVSFEPSVRADENIEYSVALNSEKEITGYAFTVSESGYGGGIEVMIGINPDGCITNVVIVSADDETPGLGQNIKKDFFLDQFKNKNSTLTVKKGAVSNDNEIQAITSATISSSAVTRAVNAAVEYFNAQLAASR